MNLSKIAALYAAHADKMIHVIDKFDENSFARSTQPGEWSVAQVMDHICATTEKCLDNALKCAKGKGERGHSGIGAAIFSWVGAFPPVKIKVRKIPPGLEKVYQPKTITKQEAIKQLKESIQQVQDAAAKISGADLSVRLAHWAGGWFNAYQWFHCTEMHIKHHFRQMNRIMKAQGVG